MFGSNIDEMIGLIHCAFHFIICYLAIQLHASGRRLTFSGQIKYLRRPQSSLTCSAQLKAFAAFFAPAVYQIPPDSAEFYGIQWPF